jgi:hypothetical protein
MTDEEAEYRREYLAFGRRIDWKSEGQLGTVHFGSNPSDEFPPLPIGTVTDLIDDGFLDPEDGHNEAPPAKELLAWARSIRDEFYSYQFEIGLTGYMVAPDRTDSRIQLNGVSIQSQGPLPEGLKRKSARRFDPDLVSVDESDIALIWD